MRTLVILGYVGVGLILSAGCGGQSEGPDEPALPADAGAPSSQADAGAGGESAIGAGGAASRMGAGGATPGMGDAGAVSAGGTVSTGGVTSGGRAFGGSAPGGAPTETIPVPEGCVSESQVEGSGMCSLGLFCDAQYSSVSCGEGAGDDWRCYCSGAFSIETYDIQAATSGVACAVAGAFCSGKGPDLEGAAEECAFTENKGPGYCDSARTCKRSVEVAGNVAAYVSETRKVSCETDETGVVVCTCPGDPPIVSLFGGVELEEDGCAFAQEFCESRTWSPAGARSCATQSSSSAPESCDLGLGCEQPIELEDGTVISRHSNEYTSCFTAGDGRSGCVCSNELGTLAFELPASSTTPATCSQAAELCGRQNELLRGDSIECLSSSQSTDGASCSVWLECTQDATVGDVPIDLRGQVQANCFQNDESWDCACTSGTHQQDDTLEAKDAWAACTAAIEACPGLVGLGPYSL